MLFILFQVQFTDGTTVETGASGKCVVSYKSVNSTEIEKTSSECKSEDLDPLKEGDEILGTKRTSSGTTVYKKEESASHFSFIVSKEYQSIWLSAKREIGSVIEIDKSLSLISANSIEGIEAENVQDAIGKVETLEKVTFVRDTLLTKPENIAPEQGTDFVKSVKNSKDFLKTEYLGTLKPIKSFVKLINLGRRSNKEEISKVLNQKKNKDIL